MDHDNLGDILLDAITTILTTEEIAEMEALLLSDPDDTDTD